MKKALIVYYKEKEKAKYSNEEIAADEIEKIFSQKGYEVKKTKLKTQKTSKKSIKKNGVKFKEKPPSTEGYNYIVIGTPIVGSLTSAQAINSFIRQIPKIHNPRKSKYVLFATGIIPGFALKKMESLLSMNGIKIHDSKAFTSIFEFDKKKIKEINDFFAGLFEK